MIALLCTAAVLLTSCDKIGGRFSGPKTAFNGDSAYSYAKQHLQFGPRTPGTPAHDKAADWIVAEMKKRTDSVSVQAWTQTTANGTKLPMKNILARFNTSATSRVLYVTHWDSRPTSDEDMNLGNRALAVMGANDGAAGVGMFIALGDVFKKTPPSVGVDLLFTDGEDWGDFSPDSTNHYPDALFGSQYFVEHLPSPGYKPLFGVLWDMIGDKDLQIFQEPNSVQTAPEVVSRVWRTADSLGYSSTFRTGMWTPITDDHVPFLQKGMHVIDVLDFWYGTPPASGQPTEGASPNYHHTQQDTIDKISAKSLQIVGDVAVALVK
jgi:glutaminyl-peptide cyclotransferase